MANKRYGDLLIEELGKLAKKQRPSVQKFQQEPGVEVKIAGSLEPQVLFTSYRYPIDSYTFSVNSVSGPTSVPVSFGPQDFVSANVPIYDGWNKTDVSWAIFKGCGVGKTYVAIENKAWPTWVTSLVVEDPIALSQIIMEELTNTATRDWEIISRQIKPPGSTEFKETLGMPPKEYQELTGEGAVKAEISIRRAIEQGLVTQDYLNVFGEWPKGKGAKPGAAVFASRYVLPQDHALAMAQSIVRTKFLEKLSGWSYEGLPGGAASKIGDIFAQRNPAIVNEINDQMLKESHRALCEAMDAALSEASQQWVDLFNNLALDIQRWASQGMEEAPPSGLIPPGARMKESETGWWTAGAAGIERAGPGGPIPPNALADIIPQYATTFTEVMSLITRHKQAWNKLQDEYARVCAKRAEEGHPCTSPTFTWDSMTEIPAGSPEAEALTYILDDLLTRSTVVSILAKIKTIKDLGIWSYIENRPELQWLEDLINKVEQELENINMNNTCNPYAAADPTEMQMESAVAQAVDSGQRLSGLV